MSTTTSTSATHVVRDSLTMLRRNRSRSPAS